jgi:hypothetical protein
MESEETAQVAGLQHPKDFGASFLTHHSSRSYVGPNELRRPRCAQAARKGTAAEIQAMTNVTFIRSACSVEPQCHLHPQGLGTLW